MVPKLKLIEKCSEGFAKKKRIIIFSALCVLLAAVLTLAILFIINVTNPFAFEKIGDSVIEAEKLASHQTQYSKSFAAGFAYKGGAAAYDGEKLNIYDTDGDIDESISLGLKQPIIRICKNYILVYENQNKDFFLIKNGKIIHSGKSEYNILGGCVSENGKILLVEDEPYYKAMLLITEDDGEELYRSHLGTSYVLDASFASNDSYFALTLLNAEIAKERDAVGAFSSSVCIGNIHESETLTAYNIENDVFIGLYPFGSGYTAICQNSMMCFSKDGTFLWKNDLNGEKITYASVCDDKIAAILTNEENIQSLCITDVSGKQTFGEDALSKSTGLSIGKNAVCIGGSDGLRFYNMKAKHVYTVKPPRTLIRFTLFNDSRFVLGISNTSAEIFKGKGK